MDKTESSTRRVVAVGLLAVAILIGLYIATGGSLPSLSLSSSNTPVPTPLVTTGPTGTIHGTVQAHVTHLKGTLWRFEYTIRNTGKAPIAGLQISGTPANLTKISARAGWNYYGAGVCKGSAKGILIYWSTGAGSPTEIHPGQSVTLSFETRTKGTTHDQYSLSWDGATPQFGTLTAPAPSTLPVTGQHCT
jgi:hypothetical protein